MLNRTLAEFACVFALVVEWTIPARAQQTTTIGVSYQPALYWSLPYYIASQKGWWKEVRSRPPIQYVSIRRAADGGRRLEIVGRRRHWFGAGHTGRPALRHSDDRHH